MSRALTPVAALVPGASTRVLLVLAVLLVPSARSAAGDWDEFRVKREAVFEFEARPVVTRNGDRVTIEFATKGLCDATVAIEDADGRILRHLASGVLGPNAPEPFRKDSKRQVVVWDGKDDRGVYVDDKDRVTVRVSLGLKPQFERTLYWDPRKTTAYGEEAPIFRAAPEGVYVYDGGWARDHLRLFDHEGNYLRTVYPFPAGKIEQVKGLHWKTLPPDGPKVPIRPGYQQATFLTSGTSTTVPSYDPQTGEFRHPSQGKPDAHFGQYGRAATALAVRGGRIALAGLKLNRLLTDGTTGELPLEGPKVCFEKKHLSYGGSGWSAPGAAAVADGGYSLGYRPPRRAALSPDGRWLYLTRYATTLRLAFMIPSSYWEHAVMRVPFDGGEAMKVFLGEPETSGSDSAHFCMPAGIDCDGQGRVCVADYYNGRVQVFSAEGKLLQSIPVDQPAEVQVHKKTGELYVFCWPLVVPNIKGYDPARIKGDRPRFVLEKFSALPEAKRLGTFELPVARTGDLLQAEVDSWSTPTRIWLAPGLAGGGPTEAVVVEERGNRLELVKDFRAEVRKAVVRSAVPEWYNQRLHVNPATGKLYLAEQPYTFSSVLEIDPESGGIREVGLPLEAEDLCFDLDGSVYLRAYTAVVRYDFPGWREIPWDYGEEMVLGKQKIIAGLPLPVNGGWHQGGIWVSPRGHLAVGCLYDFDVKSAARQIRSGTLDVSGGKKYTPLLYPGREMAGRYGAIYVHVWDRHGKLLHDDALPGLRGTAGLCLDDRDNLYVLAASPRVLDGRRYFNVATGTLIRCRPKQCKVITAGETPIPVSEAERPARPLDMQAEWVQGADWLYGGIGWDLKRGIGCACGTARISQDLYARTFAPEIDRNSIAVLDTGGNLITRVGRYGNVEDGRPLVASGGPPNPRPIGGDEVSLFCALYPAVHSDRRLFVADAGNYRVVSVKLGYHSEERIALKNIGDAGKK